MNCPQCNEPVGDDEFGPGKWALSRPGKDVITESRGIYAVRCGHCGVFEIHAVRRHYIKSVHGPFTNCKDLRRLERLIPACRNERRLPG